MYLGEWVPGTLATCPCSLGSTPPCPILELGRWFCNSLGSSSWKRWEGSWPQSGGRAGPPEACLFCGRGVLPLCGSKGNPQSGHCQG